MSLQVFLQAQLLGSEEFLGARLSEHRSQWDEFLGRAAWSTLLCEVLPRALLSSLALSRMLLGTSSAEQFLLVLGEEDLGRADAFLKAAAQAIAELSGQTLRLVWVSTENLGSWPVARKRLDDAFAVKVSAPLANEEAAAFFAPTPRDAALGDDGASSYFREFALSLAKAQRVGWSAERPAVLLCDEGAHSWALTEQTAVGEEDSIFFPRRFATDESGQAPSSLVELGERSEGTPQWGVLCGDVDHFDTRLRAAGSIEEHIHLSVLFKQFFAGELALLWTYPEFWRTVSVVYRGGDGFAVAGSWSALILLARELQRLFEKFAEQNLHTLAGVEGKTITMALALAPDADASPAAIYQRTELQLRSAKASEAGTFSVFGRTIEWARLGDAEELKSSLVRLARDFGVGRGFINDLASVYRESFSARSSRRAKAARVEKPWRTYMRVAQVLPQTRGKEFNNLRNTVITHLLGRRTAGLKLRPSARVGLEWARLAAGQ